MRHKMLLFGLLAAVMLFLSVRASYEGHPVVCGVMLWGGVVLAKQRRD